MPSLSCSVRPERPDDFDAIAQLVATVFGPGIAARAAFFLRDGVEPFSALSFVAEHDGRLVGSVRQTPVIWGDVEVLMLGPLCVDQSLAGNGIGRNLMQNSMKAAVNHAQQFPASILVGDLAYYEPFGFRRIAPEKISLPRPADPLRILGCELSEKSLERLSGAVARCGM